MRVSRPVLLLAVVGVLGVVGIISSQLIASRIFARHLPLGRLTSEVQLQATIAHLWLEELVSGDNSVNFTNDIEKPLRFASSLIEAALKGGETELGSIVAVNDPAIRRQLQTLNEKLAEFLRVSDYRARSAGLEGITGSAVDTEFDALFDEIIELGRALGMDFQELAESGKELTNLINLALVITLIFLFGFAARVVYGNEQAISHQNEELEARVVEVQSARERTESAAQKLAISVQQIVSASDELSKSAESARRESEGIGVAAEEMAASAQSLATRSHEDGQMIDKAATQVASIGSTVEEFSASLESIMGSVDTTRARFGELSTLLDSVEQFVGAIQEISSQTNLLALNAAIEAARAGEHGRGFEVVAEEVRKLADQAGQSSVRIGESVQSIFKQMDHSEEALGGITRSAEEFRMGFSNATALLREITRIIQDVRNGVESNVSNAREQAQGTDDISRSALSTLDVIRRHAQMSEEVAASAQELGRLAKEMLAEA